MALPLGIQNLVINGMVIMSTFMIGVLGESYLAGVAMATTVFFMAELIVFGLCSGSAVLIAQYHGKGDKTSISRILGIALGLSLLVSMTIAVGISLFPVGIFSLTSNDTALIAIAAEFGRIAAFALVLNALSSVYIVAQRSMENPRLAMVVQGITLLVCVFFNWVLIFGNIGFAPMGVRGAALALLIARGVEFALTFGYAFICKSFKLQFAAIFCPGKAIFKDFRKYAFPVVASESLWGIGVSMYAIIFGHMHNAVAAVAAFSITLNIERFLGAMCYGFGHACSVLLGKEVGAGQQKKALSVGVTMLTLTAGLGIVMGLLALLLRNTVLLNWVFPLFGASEYTLAYGAVMLVIMAICLPFKVVNLCIIIGTLRSGGDIRAAVTLDLGALYLVALPLSAVAGIVLGMPVPLVYLLVCTEEFTKTFFGLRRVKQKKWLTNVTQ